MKGSSFWDLQGAPAWWIHWPVNPLFCCNRRHDFWLGKHRFFHETGLEKRSRRENSAILREISFRVFLVSKNSAENQPHSPKIHVSVFQKYIRNCLHAQLGSKSKVLEHFLSKLASCERSRAEIRRSLIDNGMANLLE